MAKQNKKLRQEIYDKYNGHCAYCGCEIEFKDMQVDHIIPKYRNNEMWHKGEIGTDDVSNLNPSCRMCNYYKRMYSLEQFRENLSTMLIANVRRPFDYRLAVKYGLVKEDVKKVKFYFESQGVKVKEIKTIEERAKEYADRHKSTEINYFGVGNVYGYERIYNAEITAYERGAKEQKAIDEEVRLKKCDDITEAECEREVAFADWYNKNGKGTPTYSDAIEWVRRELIDEACEIVRNIANEYFGDWEQSCKVEDTFRKAMEE